jgi:hypothetical protein
MHSQSHAQHYIDSLRYLKDLTENSKKQFDKHGFLIRDKRESKTRAQKLIDALTRKVRNEFITEIMEEDLIRAKQEQEKLDKEVQAEKA